MNLFCSNFIGPAKFSLNTCFTLQTMFWLSFIGGRLISVFLAFKLNTLIFLFFLLVSNIIIVGSYAIPYINSIKYTYWFLICALGLVNGPLVPGLFMTMKHVLVCVNAFIVSIFCIGSGLGQIISQHMAARILDKFEPYDGWFGYSQPTSVFTIPLILFIYIIFCFTIFLLLLFVYKRYNHTFKCK